ncbi:MAG: HAD-IA family hydrolase [Oribacterium sp.]|nr:HAD-IA family hydrolase [Oribacterium sp.]
MYDLEKIRKYKLLVFDMDGTLFDTSESNYWSYHDAAQEFGYGIEHDKFLQVFVGRNYKEFLPVFGITGEKELKYIHDFKKEHYKDYISKIKKNDVLFSIMDKLKTGRKIALATTASRTNTMDVLEYFDVLKYFDYVLTQEDVTKLKPDPECYNIIMEKMQFSPKETVIFEDSIVGIEAAIASGADYIAVNDFQI